MSRSRRKTPIFGVTAAESEKEDKKRANRCLRREVRKALRNCDNNGDDEILMLRETTNWTFAKEGKYYRDDLKMATIRESLEMMLGIRSSAESEQEDKKRANPKYLEAMKFRK
jgi:hypothetical protein